jgi:glycosyltransferase involved in cell wall biosynthesis
MLPKRVSIIIPTYNRCASLRNTLLSLFHQTYPADQIEVVLVDNGSTDGTQNMVRSLAAPYQMRFVTVIKQKPFESSRIRNIGIREANGDFIIFLDSDMVVPPRFVEQHMAFHLSAPGVAVLGKMIYLESNESLSDSVILGTFAAEKLGPARVAGDTVQRFLEHSGNLPQYLRPWDFCIAANFSVSRESIEQAGMFDEAMDGDLPAAADIAYGLQMYSKGIRLVYGRAAIGFHQRNHALTMAEDPQYFHQRRDSVWAQEERVHNRWLSGSRKKQAIDHIESKRALNAIVEKYHAKYTLQIEKGKLGRITRQQTESARPGASVLLISDSDIPSLHRALTIFSDQDCGPEAFEVIVLDPTADVDEMTDDYSAAAHIEVQSTEVHYALRYFPTGTLQHSARLKKIRQRYLQNDDLTAEAGRLLLSIENQSYARNIRRLLLEKPTAEVSLTFRTSKVEVDRSLLSHILQDLQVHAETNTQRQEYSGSQYLRKDQPSTASSAAD